MCVCVCVCMCVCVCRMCTCNDKLHMKKVKMPGQHISLVSRPCGLAVRFRKNRSGSDQFWRMDGTRAATRVDGKDFSYYHTFDKLMYWVIKMRKMIAYHIHIRSTDQLRPL